MAEGVVSFVTEGLGHSSHLVALGDGTALVIDPARLPTGPRDYAARSRLELAYTADTHTHADYVSGSPELAAATGATFFAPSAAGLAHPHEGLRDGDELRLGRFRLVAISTPGHTLDHLSYLLVDERGPVALFSGGSLMVGTVGRTDLVDDEGSADRARALYRALHERILVLPDALPVYPTHGAGSFCSAPGGAEPTTTIGRERATNPLLTAGSEDEFVDKLLAGLGSFPPYFRRLPALNQRGARRYDRVPELTPLTVAEVERHVAEGADVVDVRPVSAFAAGHIPGALSIALRGGFAPWLGWLVEPDRPIVFVLDDDQDEADLVRQCLTIGVEGLAGKLGGGIDAWQAAGRRVASTTLVEPDQIDRPLLDVRQRHEYADGHVPGAFHCELGTLAQAELPITPVATMCGQTERAMTGASLLERAGHADAAAVHGGFSAWSARPGNTADTSR